MARATKGILFLTVWTAFFAVFFLLLPLGGATAQTIPQSREQMTLSFSPLVKQTAPAVVNIYARKMVRQKLLSPLFEDPLFRQFFGDSLPQGLTRERMENSLGSGVIVSANGLIVTNNHVIRGADEITVVLSDRREFAATMELTDEKSDLAVLRIKAKGEIFPFLRLKDSDAIDVGDLVLAIGNPFGVGQTVTSGIVSAVARTDLSINDLNYFIQTDAAINPGNSGGALVAMDGRLVGINSAIYSQSGGSLGIGFAIPANLVRTVIESVGKGQQNIVRPWLGVAGQNITADLAASLDLPRPFGVLVNHIHPRSPAAKAELQVGDVIQSVNGKEVDDYEGLRFRIATMPVGSAARLGVLRQGVVKEINFTLIAPPEDPPREETQLSGQQPLAGATIVNLSPAVSEELAIHDDVPGVIVTKVMPRSIAMRFGVRPGDVITQINDTPVVRVKDAIAATRQKSPGWSIRLQRDGQSMNILVRP